MTKRSRPERGASAAAQGASASPSAVSGPGARRTHPAHLADGRPGGHAALALWCALALLAATRAALAFVPSMWGWGLNHPRFLSPGWAWLPWLVAAAALVPAFATRALPLATRIGDRLTNGGRLPVIAVMLLAACLVSALPDRTHFTGDFLLRESSAAQPGAPGALIPQALPLDVVIHDHVPYLLTRFGVADVNTAARVLGAVETAVLAWLAVGLVRSLTLRGAPALAIASIVFFGGSLALFTGYDKAFSELVLVAVATGVFGVRALRDGSGVIALGALAALAVLLHRSGLALLPAVAVPMVVGLGAQARPRRLANVVGVALPLLALAMTLPRIVDTFVRFDLPTNLAPEDVRQAGAWWRAAFAPVRLADIANVIVMLAPVSLALPALVAAPGRGRNGVRAQRLWLLTLVLPILVLLLADHPPQGFFRDWDVFAAPAALLSIAVAIAVGKVLAGAPHHGWLAVAVALAAAAPSLQWVALQADSVRGLERARAFVAEHPVRAPAERGRTWAFLASRAWQQHDLDRVVEYAGRAAQTSPSTYVLTLWATAEELRGGFAAARPLYRRALAADPTDWRNWLGLASASLGLGDHEEARRAVQRSLQLHPHNPYADELLARASRLARDGARSPARPGDQHAP